MAETHMDMMAQQLEDIAKDITGTTVTKRSYAWDRIDNAVTTIAEAVGASVPNKKYNSKKERVAALVTAIADTDVSGGGGGNDDAIIMRTLSDTYQNSTATYVGDYAFYKCSKLTSVNLTACTSIGSNAFYACSKLASVSFPVCTSVDSNAFADCSSLTTISFPACTFVGTAAFIGCYNTTSISFPACITVNGNAFQNCAALTSVSLPSCKKINSYAFGSCTSLATVYAPVCSQIYGNAFATCSNLLSLYLLSSTLVTLSNSNAFAYTPIGGSTASTGGVYGSIYVPASMIDAYKSATNWTYFSSRFVAYSA